MTVPKPLPPLLSYDLQGVIGLAIVDEAFQRQLLANPRKAVAGFVLTPTDRRAACAITGASSLAEYALLLEQRLARGKRAKVAVGREKPARAERMRAAS